LGQGTRTPAGAPPTSVREGLGEARGSRDLIDEDDLQIDEDPYDRILAVNALGTKTVILVAILSFTTGRPEFLDIALLYTLINFVVTIAILKYKEIGRLG